MNVTKTRIESILRPASVALVGASQRPGSLGDVVRRNLRDAGFDGPVYYVNPAHRSVGDQPAFRSVSDLPEAVDLAVIVTPAEAVPGVITDCGERGVAGAVLITSSFGEGGASGDALESEIRQRARRYGLRLLGPGSLGVLRTDNRLNAAAGPALPLPGRLALVSQSGPLCSALLDWARSRQVGFSTVISTGGGIDIGFGEILDFLVRDPTTDSIMLYMEGVDDARRFMSALRAAARVKPVVVMKAGRRPQHPDARAHEHGARLGADDVFDAAMRRAGVLRMRDFRDFFTATATLASGARVNGRRLAIVSNAGGPGTLAADRATARWLQLAQLGPATLQKLEDLLPPQSGPGNPVCMRGEVEAAQYAAAVAACLEDPDVDALLAIHAPHVQADPCEFSAALIEATAKRRKPVFACWMGGESVAASRADFAEHKVPSYNTPEAAVDAIAALSRYAANQEQLLQVPEPLARESMPDRDAAQAVIDAAIAAGREWLDPADSGAVLAAFGIPVVQVRGAHPADDAPTAGPPHDRRHGRELRIGVVRDPVFGPAITFGLGGALAEVIGDHAAALPPLNHYLAHDLVRRTRASLALQPLHGAPAADEAAVEEVLLRVSELVCEMPDIAALDLNPVVATAAGAFVVDARVAVRRSPVAARPYRHMAIHPYPSALVHSIELQDGVRVTIRPIRPEDAAIEHAFVHGLSEQSRFLRFMFALHDLAPAMLSRFTQIDYDRELALVAVLDTAEGERQIGVARYITLEDETTCEFAIVVGDEWQGKGLARQLFAALIDAARHTSLDVMTGVTLRENTRMLELARASGFALKTDGDDPSLVQMTLPLRGPTVNDGKES